MTGEQSENAITLSALVVGGMFAYRKAVEPNATEFKKEYPEPSVLADYKSVFGAAPPIGWAQWLKAVGSLYIGISIVGAMSPQVGGSLAILVGTSAVIGQGLAVAHDLKSAPAPTRGAKTGNPTQNETPAFHSQQQKENIDPAFGPGPGIAASLAPMILTP